MSENVKCPVCGKAAQWYGCSGCGDDSGTTVCKKCGAVIQGIPLSTLERGPAVEKDLPKQSCQMRC
jgi:hypothetical protein